MATSSTLDRHKQHPHAVGKTEHETEYVQYQIGCQLVWKQKLHDHVDSTANLLRYTPPMSRRRINFSSFADLYDGRNRAACSTAFNASIMDGSSLLSDKYATIATSDMQKACHARASPQLPTQGAARKPVCLDARLRSLSRFLAPLR